MCSSSHPFWLSAQSNFPSILQTIWFYKGLCCPISQISDFFFPFLCQSQYCSCIADFCPYVHNTLRPYIDEKWVSRHKSTAFFLLLLLPFFFFIGNLSFLHTHISQQIGTSWTEGHFIKRYRASKTKNLCKTPYCRRPYPLSRQILILKPVNS